MAFTERAKTIVLAIVHIFETAKPFGDYGAVAVLSDGAGFSVGINQFTHKSGSLAKVIMRFMELGGEIPDEISFALPDFKSGRNIAVRSADRKLRNAIKSLGTDELWRQAQREIAFEHYLKPALDACEGSKFKHPLSLAVIYDSINQGSFPKVRDRVSVSDTNEKAWIAEYCADRKAFLASSRKAIVRSTVYRPNFFLSLIANNNWDLKLPINVNGHRLTEAILFPNSAVSTTASLGATTVEDTGSTSLSESSEAPQVPPTINVDVTNANEQDVHDIAHIESVKPYNDIGLKGTLINDAKAIVPTNFGLGTISEWLQQTAGLPEWVATLVPKLFIGALILTGVWFVYRLVSYVMHSWRENERVKLLAMINTDKSRKDIVLK